MTSPSDPAASFLERSRHYLVREYPTKIRACLGQLTEDDVWWRPHRSCNSVGNLLLHLSGNVRQWVVSGIGNAPDARRRQEEFDAQGPIPKADLLRDLENVLAEADRALARVRPEHLGESRMIQNRQTTVLLALYHVVEHFAMHTGQIVYVTKLRTGQDLGFYRDAGGKAEPTRSDFL